MKKNNKYIFMILLASLIVSSNFCMDVERSRSSSFSASLEHEFDPATSPYGLPDPYIARNRISIIETLTARSSAQTLERAIGLINHVAQHPDFKVFLNNRENFLTIVHALSKTFDLIDAKGNTMETSDMEVCNSLKVERASIQSSLQKKLNTLCRTAITTEKHKSDFVSLIKQGVDVDFSTNLLNETVTPLMLAIINDNEEMVRLLLQANANPDKGMYKGNTPLIMCILKNNAKLVKMLLKAGASLNIPNKEDVFPLGVAKDIDNKKIINIIRDSVKTRK